MIYIISGGIDSGKTSGMIELYRRSAPGSGDGLVTRKIYAKPKPGMALEGSKRDSDDFIGYELLRLSTGESQVLLLLASKYNGEFQDSFTFGRFVFSQEGFRFGKAVIQELLDNENIQDIYLDEVGPVELQGKGFCSILRKAMKSDKNLYLTVRDQCLEELLEKFGDRRSQVLLFPWG